MTHAMARTCDTDGRWPHSKGPKATGTVALPNTNLKFERRNKDRHSKIGLFSHQRCCSINPGANPWSHKTDRGLTRLTEVSQD